MAMYDSGRMMDDEPPRGSHPTRRQRIGTQQEEDDISDIAQLKKQVTSIEERLVMMQRSMQEITTLLRNIQAAGLRIQTHSRRDEDLDLI